ncbi:MAG TPA: hypothetical protein VKQ36_13885, partial [Ktedonobacterales bacterium]|nr:hypothetical protein [Ktedonobacterales bacterium]
AALYIATLLDMLMKGIGKLGGSHQSGVRFNSATKSAGWVQIGLTAFLCCVIGASIVAQTALTARGGVISLQDGQYGLSCASVLPADIYLVEHYNGGRLLDDTFHTSIHFEWAHIGFNSIIYEGSGELWNEALARPEVYAEWIVAAPHDLVSQHIALTSPAFRSHFILVAQDADGAQLFHARSDTPLPNRPLPIQTIKSHALCGANNSSSGGG